MNEHFHGWRKFACLVVSALPMTVLTPVAGCSRTEATQEKETKNEKVFDLEAPGISVEVERSEDGGSVDVKVNPQGKPKD
jgi:hypothetical protein